MRIPPRFLGLAPALALALAPALTVGLMATAGTASAAMMEKTVAYELDGTAFEGVLVYDDATDTVRPAVLMVPNWMGVTPPSVEKAKLLAGDDYVILVADVYGKTVRPQDAKEAGEVAGSLRSDRPLLRARANKAMEVLLAQTDAPIDPARTAAIGFCFGGGTVLEMARSGTDLGAVVSFHGNLDTPDPALMKDAAVGGVLVLHGADDPYVPAEQVRAFTTEMQATDLDWQLVAFGNTVHSFTDPNAAMAGKAEYNETSAKRAFAMMHAYFDEKL